MPQDIFYTHVKPSDCAEIVEKTIMNGQIIERLLYKMNGKSYATQEEVPFYNKQHRIVLEQLRPHGRREHLGVYRPRRLQGV